MDKGGESLGQMLLGKYGQLRLDGTPKSSGWLGEIRMPDGITVMTEQSVGEPGSNEIFRPSITPGMHPAVVNYIRQTDTVPEDAYATSNSFAIKRLMQGLSPFYNDR